MFLIPIKTSWGFEVTHYEKSPTEIPRISTNGVQESVVKQGQGRI